MFRRFFILASSLPVTGCMVGPNYHAPQTSMPPAWVSPTTAPTTQSASVPMTQQSPVGAWWTTFNDPQLDSLIQRAVDSNLDLRQAEARIRQARAARGVVSANFWPNANTSASYQRSYSGRSGVSNSSNPSSG